MEEHKEDCCCEHHHHEQECEGHGHHHEHEHGHHHHHVVDFESVNRAFYIGIGLNLLYTFIEYAVGYRINSLALLSDATHNLSDVASLFISLIGMKLSQKAATQLYTYGYKKSSILASLINALLLMYIVVRICIEACERLANPPEMVGSAIMITAFIGVIINAASAFLFYKGQHSDINIKGAFLHLIVDALVSVGVIISGAIVYFTGWHIADPISSFIVAIVILVSTWGLLKESMKLILDGVPSGIDSEEIKRCLESHPMVQAVHHIHIWALSSDKNALTAHIVLKECVNTRAFMEIKHELKHRLLELHIAHTTLEIDAPDCHCEEEKCE